MNKKTKNQEPLDWSSLITLILTIPIFLILLINLYLRSENANTLTPILIATGEWSPYSGEELPDYGITSKIVTEVLKKNGYQAQFQFLPWDRTLSTARLGQTNQQTRATFPWRKTPKRDQQFYLSEPIIENIAYSAFYNLDKTPELDELQRFQKISIQQLPYQFLSIKSYEYPNAIATKKMNRQANDNIDAFNQLLNDPKVNLVIESTQVGQQILREHFPREQARIQSTPQLYLDDLRLMASRRNPHNLRLIEKFNQALQEMKRDGSLATLQADITNKLDSLNTVKLQPFAPDGYLRGYLTSDGKQYILLPKGTQAVIETWSMPYLMSQDTSVPLNSEDTENPLVEVRILNGPLSQKILYVDGRSIHLPE